MSNLKKCTKCGEEKPLSEFFKDKGQKSGLKPSCKTCCKKKTREWINENPEKRKFYVLKSSTGVTKEQYENMLKKQDCKCAICSKTIEENAKNLAVDHCHDTMIVRGLLCNTCNLAIGYFQDNPDLMEKAIQYLKSPVNDDTNIVYKK